MPQVLQILTACFAGGVTFVALALLIGPAYWYLATLPSFATGYSVYQLAEVRYQIPIAWRAAVARGQESWRVGEEFAATLNVYWTGIVKWFKMSHPFYYPALIIWIPTAHLMGFWTSIWDETVRIPSLIFSCSFLTIGVSLFFLVSIITTIAVSLLTALSLVRRNEYTRDFCGVPILISTEVIKKNKMTEVEMTYRGVGIHSFLGFLVLIQLPFLLFGRFLILLVRLSHSNERTLCGTAGVIGGGATYFLATVTLGLTFTAPLTTALLILHGGLVGALLGYLDWQYLRPWLMDLIQSQTVATTI